MLIFAYMNMNVSYTLNGNVPLPLDGMTGYMDISYDAKKQGYSVDFNMPDDNNKRRIFTTDRISNGINGCRVRLCIDGDYLPNTLKQKGVISSININVNVFLNEDCELHMNNLYDYVNYESGEVFVINRRNVLEPFATHMTCFETRLKYTNRWDVVTIFHTKNVYIVENDTDIFNKGRDGILKGVGCNTYRFNIKDYNSSPFYADPKFVPSKDWQL